MKRSTQDCRLQCKALPTEMAAEVIAVANGNPVSVFWTGNGLEQSAATNWQHEGATLRDLQDPEGSGSNQGPLTIPESSLQRQRWLPVPLNSNQLPLNVTLTR
jgi:hypothetical protein